MYVIKDLNKDLFVDLDLSSGGYPYYTTLVRSYKWMKLEDAQDYLKLFKDQTWVIEELLMETRPVEQKIKNPS